jgi:hypothetical protein
MPHGESSVNGDAQSHCGQINDNSSRSRTLPLANYAIWV